MLREDKILGIGEARNGWRMIFKEEIPPIDWYLTFAYQKAKINLSTFEEWLYKKYPSDIDLSIHDIVLKHYGEKGVELIQKLI